MTEEAAGLVDARTRPPTAGPARIKNWAVAAGVGILSLLALLTVFRPAARPAETLARRPDTVPIRRVVPPPAPIEDRVDVDRRSSVVDHASVKSTSSAARVDSAVADQKKRIYDSLFASNIAVGKPKSATTSSARSTGLSTGRAASVESASLQDIADATVEATRRAGGYPRLPGSSPDARPETPLIASHTPTAGQVAKPDRTPPLDEAGALHTLLEGTLINAVLKNRVEGSGASPVLAQVSGDIYSHGGAHVLIPDGATLIGESKPVQGYADARIGVGFHRIILPNGSTIRLDQAKGLNQIGELGLSGSVNRHYLSTLMFATGVGVATGVGQMVGNIGLGGRRGNNSPTVIAGSVGQSTAQATNQALQRDLARPPTITIPEASRLLIYLSEDVSLPAYPTIQKGRHDDLASR